MSEQQIRSEIIKVCRWMARRGFIAAQDGAVSARIAENRILITPRGEGFNWLFPEQLAVLDVSGNITAARPEPSLAFRLHMTAYRQREDIAAVIHAQPPTATAFAVSGTPLVHPALPETVLTLGSVPLAPYAVPYSEDAAQAIAGLIRRHDALLLKNRGLLTVGLNLMDALHKLERVEQLAYVLVRAKSLGHIDLLPGTEVMRLMTLRERLHLEGKNPLSARPGEETDD